MQASHAVESHCVARFAQGRALSADRLLRSPEGGQGTKYIRNQAQRDEEISMKLTKQKSLCAVLCLSTGLAWMAVNGAASAQGFTTTTVQGTVYLANGHPGSGSLQVSWPAFTTANNQAVTAGRMNVTIGGDGYVSLNLAANLGATPAGLYYTAVYHLSDGTTSTEY